MDNRCSMCGELYADKCRCMPAVESDCSAVFVVWAADLKARGFTREPGTYNWRNEGLMYDEEHNTWWHWGWQVSPVSWDQVADLVNCRQDATGRVHP